VTPTPFVPGALGLASMAGHADAVPYLANAEVLATQVPGVTAGEGRSVRCVGVVGGGTMGRGIATSCASAGLNVVIVESNPATLDAVLPAIRATYERSIARGQLTVAQADSRLGRIRVTGRLADLAEADCVIEAVFESLRVKQEVFRALDQVCRAGAILATNTSTLDVDAIAAVTRRPGDVLGMHFFAPAHVMRMLEIVRGAQTSPAVIATALDLSGRLGKAAVVVGVCFGFVGNRMAFAYGSEAARLLLEGATPWQIDRALESWGFAMGPFAVSDLSGLDIDWLVRKEMTLTDEQRRLALVDDELVARGRLGQKTGAGFYRYSGGIGGARQPDPEVEELVASIVASLGMTRRAIPDSEILERCLLALINEGGHLLDDGIALRASDIDLVYAHGFGFPKRFGGPMLLGETIGSRCLIESLETYQRLHGARFAPAAVLRAAAATSPSS